MVNYQLGKVYKIVGNGKIYVGSTCKRLLCQRLAGHHGTYKQYQKGKGCNVTSHQCLTDPDHYIELLELCPSDSKDELLKCERKWIDGLECVNKYIVGRTMKEYKEENKEKIKDYQKAYQKAYYGDHRDDRKAYYEENYIKEKDHINELRRQRRAKQKQLNKLNN
jgi:hypothetical protein